MAKENYKIKIECGHTKGTFSWHGNRISTGKLFSLLPDNAPEDCRFTFIVNSGGKLGFYAHSAAWKYSQLRFIDFTGNIKVIPTNGLSIELSFCNGIMKFIDDETIEQYNNLKAFKEKLATLVKEHNIRIGIELYRESKEYSECMEDNVILFSEFQTKNKQINVVKSKIPEGCDHYTINTAQVTIK